MLPRDALPVGIEVAHGHGMAPVEQAQCHAQAHVADADDANVDHGNTPLRHLTGWIPSNRRGTGSAEPLAASRAGQLCIRRRLLATDISMPRPRPSVTIAVPP
jgi:hypothetical protein